MAAYDHQVNQQYGRHSLSDQIIAALEAAGKDIDHLTRDDLSTFDEFHIGGLQETRNLAERIPDFRPGMRVLDIGSGLGGPARTLAAEYGCEVVGLDLTEEFCEAAARLTDLVGLSDRVTFQHGDALDMPFEDYSFDVVWTQFAGMNIEDKHGLYAQCRRVLRDGGCFAFHEVLAGNTPDLIYPVFWADTAEINHLRSPDVMQQTLEAVGFRQVEWVDLTQYSTDWFEKMLAARKNTTEKPPLGFNVFVGESTPQKAANVIQNLQEGRVRVVQAVYQKEKA